ncbi:aquaporin [Salinispora cortesiana]|uniref:aquaporin n=1 Tax=Salinispora cortesiana TaxID=1305843 RepID=UPI0003FA9AE8|nr:aquaporin [Salinispora cortesiana]
MTSTLWRRLLAEFTGTALLVTAVVSSGIMATTLAPDQVGLQLLANSITTAFTLGTLILIFGPVSGAHFNPVVSAADWFLGRRAGTGLTAGSLGAYGVAQVLGGIAGAVLAHLMFDLAAIDFAGKERAAWHLWIGEIVATSGLVLLIFALARSGRASVAPAAVGAYIGAASWFTSSTSFANPAVTIGRAFSDTFAGIAPTSVPGFILAQLAGLALGIGLLTALYPDAGAAADQVVVPAESATTGSQGPPNRRAGRRRCTGRPPPRSQQLDEEEHLGVAPSESTAPGKPSVLFVSVHDVSGSQLAAGWLRQLAGDTVEVRSAGSAPAGQVDPAAAVAMWEVGIDITGQVPTLLRPATAASADIIITIGRRSDLPDFPAERHENWELDDSTGLGIEAIRPVRDELRNRVQRLLTELRRTPGSTP